MDKVAGILLSLMLLSSVLAQDKYEFVIKTDKKSGVYEQGETVKYSVKLLKNGEPCKGVKYTCRFSVNGFWKEKKEFVSDGEFLELSKKFEAPVYWYTLKAELPGTKVSSELGAIASPYEITTAVKEPDDFDAFWKLQREELDKVPVKELEKKEIPLLNKFAGYKNKVVCYDVKVACAGDKPVSGYLCMPKNAKAKSLPAVVTFQGAGVLGAWQEPQFGEKAITLNINAHGIENGKPYSWYRALTVPNGKGKLDNYSSWGVWKKELYYYKGVYTRVMRALDYVKSLPEWDGKNLLVYGASQGGTQSIVAAALDKDVTFCHAGVPALCDHSATYADRTPGWPCLVRMEKSKLNNEKKWFMVVLNYYDVAHFAKRVKCEIRVSAGLLDHTCSPTSVMAAYNNIPAGVKKYIQIVPDGIHGNASRGMQEFFSRLLENIAKGNK